MEITAFDKLLISALVIFAILFLVGIYFLAEKHSRANQEERKNVLFVIEIASLLIFGFGFCVCIFGILFIMKLFP